MAAITGRLGLILTVRDPVASARWYGAVLGMDATGEHASANGEIDQICLRERASGFVLCLIRHEESTTEAFCETRIGLDHVEFFVATPDDLDEWADRLTDLGVSHSGVKTPPYTQNRMITFRDPDNIQLELFWEAAER